MTETTLNLYILLEPSVILSILLEPEPSVRQHIRADIS